MYNEYFGLSRAPFRITPDTALFYTGGSRGDVLDALVYAITSGEGIVKVVGEVGTGKTMLCRMLEERLPDNVQIAYLANPSLTPQDILHAVALELELGVASEANRLQVMHHLQESLLARHANNQRVVVLVEEAQSMPVDTLEEIRLLSNLETKNEKLLQIVLFGQPELDETLSKPQIRQLRERITHSFTLKPLGREEVRDYVAFRLRASGYRGRDAFTSDAYRTMSRASEGLTRRVNIIADKAMLAAFADDTHDVSAKHVKCAIADSEFSTTRTRKRQPSVAAMACVAVVAVFVAGAVGWYAGNQAGSMPLLSDTQMPTTAAHAPSPQPHAAAQVRTPPAQQASVTMQAGTPPVAAEAAAVPSRAMSPGTTTEGRIDTSASVGASVGAAVPTTGLTSVAGIATPAVAVDDQPKVATAVSAPRQQAVAMTAESDVATRAIAAPGIETERAVAETQRAPVAPRRAQDAIADGPASAKQVAKVDSDEASAGVVSPVTASIAPTVASAPQRDDDGQASVPQAPVTSSAPPAVRVGDADSLSAGLPADSGQRSTPRAGDKQMHESLLQWRLAQTREWLQGVAKNHYSIQLLATDAAQRENLEVFLSRRELGGRIDRIFVYRTRINAREWYGVLFGEFSRYTQAREALRELPRELQLHQPFIRNIKDINALG